METMKSLNKNCKNCTCHTNLWFSTSVPQSLKTETWFFRQFVGI